jgi:hypothetical protein
VAGVQGDVFSDAVDWLVVNQDPSGLWGTDKTTPFRDATMVAVALSDVGYSGATIDDGIQAINSTPTSTTDYLARKIVALVFVNESDIDQGLLDSLADLQNADGGWGFARGYGSSVFETGLALVALGNAQYSGSSALSSGMSYLQSSQNPDGGWPVVDGDTSRVYYTGYAMLGLASMWWHSDVSAELAAGDAWLRTQPHVDGGYGTGDASNPFETGLALMGLSLTDPTSAEALAARAYLESSQLPNGSWNDDAYSTALAMMGIYDNLGVDSRSLALLPGLNLAGLPLDPVDPLSSTDFCGQIDGCSEITGWDRFGQNWLSGGFAIAVQDAFFVNVSTASIAPTLGSLLDANQCTTLEPGLNAVSIPNEDACYSGSMLMGEIADCIEAHKWDPEKQKWITYTQTRSDTIQGADFSVATGEGVFVRVLSGGEWCTSACDTVTVPELPDLLITSADIYINPNPATEGESDTIFARIQNIGTVSVSNPRLDFYMGDPDQGGSSMATEIYIPETIPPGGVSGYYGYVFVWGGTGTVNIYAVADINDAIEELSENNNKAFKPLTIEPALAPSKRLPGFTTATEINATVVGEVEVLPPMPGGKQMSNLSLGGNAAEISQVSVLNVTSSSATVTWLTDSDVDGCVNFGFSSPSENSKCAYGLSGGMHYVELSNLSENTTYVFEVESGGTVDDNGGSYYSFTTTPVGAGVPSVLFGRILDDYFDRWPPPEKDDVKYDFAPSVVVSAAAINGADTSGFIAAVTDWDGTWILNLGNLKDQSTGFPYSYGPGDEILINATGGYRGNADTLITLSGGSPQNAGELVLTEWVCGDANNSGSVDIDDVMFIINYIFGGGPAPNLIVGNVNCLDAVDIDDIMYIINYIFGGGPVPCADCPI